MKKILIIILLSVAGLTSIGAAIHSNSSPSISQFDYYENAPFSPIATISEEKKKEIEKIVNNRKEKERRDKISNAYKEIKRIEEERRIEEEKRLEQVEEEKRKEAERVEEEKKIRAEQEAKHAEENKKIVENTNNTVEAVKEEDAGTKIVSGNLLENPLIEVKDLSASDKTIAYRIIEAIKNGEREVYFEQEDFEHIFNIVQAIEDEYFYVELASNLEVEGYTDGSIKVFIASNTLDHYNKSQYASSTIKSFSNSLKGLTEKAAVRRLNDWIVNNMSYSENVRDLYSLTYSHVGNCDSFSQIFELVCDELGIESKSVHGYIKNTGEHMWNRVKIDGVWYYIDTTFNQTYDNEYYLSTSLWTETHEIWEEYKREWTIDE